MHIVIDMQGAQSGGCFQRFGPYPTLLVQAIARNCEHDITLVLNGLFPESIEAIRTAFAGLVPQENIRVWHAPAPVDYLSAPAWRVDVAENIREYFISSLKPDVILVTALFDDFDDNTVISIGKTFRASSDGRHSLRPYSLFPSSLAQSVFEKFIDG